MSYVFVSGAVTYTAYNVTDDAFTDEYEEAEIDLIGRGRRVEVGTRWGLDGTLTVQIYDQIAETGATQRANLLALKTTGIPVQMTNAFGTTVQVSIGVLEFTRVAGVGNREYFIVTIPYKEVI